jgi:hypothetical protein
VNRGWSVTAEKKREYKKQWYENNKDMNTSAVFPEIPLTNAKQEFLDFIKEKPAVKCAWVEYSPSFTSEEKRYILNPDYTRKEFEELLNCLDFDYNAGHKIYPCIFGVIFFSDGTWAERDEYEGAEKWLRIVKPYDGMFKTKAGN